MNKLITGMLGVCLCAGLLASASAADLSLGRSLMVNHNTSLGAAFSKRFSFQSPVIGSAAYSQVETQCTNNSGGNTIGSFSFIVFCNHTDVGVDDDFIVRCQTFDGGGGTDRMSCSDTGGNEAIPLTTDSFTAICQDFPITGTITAIATPIPVACYYH